MRCMICRRPMLQAAATMPAGHDKAEPFKAGPVGPTCAARVGLSAAPTLFDRKRAARKAAGTRKARRCDVRQRDWVRDEVAA